MDKKTRTGLDGANQATYYCTYSVPQRFVVLNCFFFGLRAVLILSRRPQYIKNAS
jgi:hypothetical protein